ncbi:HYR domain-containing protein [Pontibacter sp. KCTC 32443]|uniref:HYR domain-containing protein n=1 Tax=Pontibacter TaxID=323449 RepID=UPI00164DEA5D|nr:MULTISPECIES: HYR domain-containing protein [Pontibacter]MBC5773334.1 HYR domain-containing protein [Pontibacter sp. KCTC 32443]
MNVRTLLNQNFKWRVLYLATFIATLSIIGVSALDIYQPSVTSDKEDYYPGDTAHITGYGWTQDQIVYVELKEEPDYPDFHKYEVTVDSNGTWRIDYPIEWRHLGVKFTVVAVGKQSGYTTTHIFTDAPRVGSVTISPIIRETCIPTGSNTSTVTYIVDPTRGSAQGSNGNTTVGFCITGLPSGVTSSFDPTTVSSTGQADFPATTLTLTTTSSTQAGTYIFTVKAFNTSSGNCNTALDFAIATGTLIVNPTPNAPSAPSPQAFCSADEPTVADLTATGSNLQWYTSENGGTALASTTALASGNYYVSQTTNNCESARTTVAVTVNETPATPTITAESNTTVCPGSSVILTSSTSSGNQWYRNRTVISGATNQSFTASESGSYTVVVTSNGCSSAASDPVVVTVEDNTPPATPTIAAATGECSVTVTAPTTTDNCAGTITGTTTNPTTYTEQGTYTITWTFADGNGNTTTQTQQVIVDDVTAPELTAAENQEVALNDNCSVIIPDVRGTATDNCQSVTITQTPAIGAVVKAADGQQISVNITATDAAGNTDDATVTLTAQDLTAPTITAPADVQVSANASCQASDVALGTPTTADNCTVASVTNNAPATYILGENRVNWTVTDAAGLTTTATQIVTVVDNTAPAAPTILAARGECSVTVTDAPTAQDNCGGTITGTTSDPLTYTQQGEYTITWSFNDGNGNTSTATQQVIVDDVTAPVAPVLADATGECSVTVTAPTTTDNCAGTITGTTTSPTTYNEQGTYTITWTFNDGNGNTITATQHVIVDDVTAPVIAAVEPVTAPADADQCSATLTITAPEVTDNCEANPVTGTRDDGAALDAQYPVGTTTITWNATDANGNAATPVTQTVTVNDIQAPTITAPADVEVAADASCRASNVALGTPTTVDNCSVASVSNNAPSSFPLGETQVIWTVTDAAGLTATATQVVTVVDETAPVLTAAADQEVTLGENCSVIIPDVRGTATDNCSAATITQSPVAGTTVAAVDGQQIIVTVTATDVAGNSSTDQVTLTAQDVTAPVLTAAADQNVELGASCSIVVPDVTGSATDNCQGTTITQAPVAGTVVNATDGEQIAVLVTATDAAGNTDTDEVVLTAQDITNPIVVAGSDQTSGTDSGACTARIAIPDATFSDNCAGSQLSWEMTGATTGNGNGQIGTYTFNSGVTTITYTATDAAGNTATDQLLVTVTDDEAPVVTAPANIVVSTDPGKCGAVVNYTMSASDNCSNVTPEMTAGLSSGATFPVGTTTVTYEASDEAGNKTTQSFTVTIQNAAPSNLVITGPVSPIQLGSDVTLKASFTDENIASATWDWGNGATTTQAITGSPISATYKYAQPGVYTVGLTVKDHCGESTSTQFNYVVVFDPNGGFVTGGGWIDSPPGAYVANPTLVGKANFGFNAKYKKGSTEVDGNTEFQFKAGDLHFKSSAHDAMTLVVAGYKAMYKGVGSVNGNDNYAFMVSVIDGNLKGKAEADRFRIKIWDRRSGAIVYDNQLGAADNADATTAIGGGSIVIHDAKGGSLSTSTTARLVTPSTIQQETGKFYNYPNTFTDRTTIAFSLDREESYSLEVYDMRGALIRKVDMGVAKAGKLYEYEFDGTNISKGIYIARLVTPSGARSIKMLLSK